MKEKSAIPICSCPENSLKCYLSRGATINDENEIRYVIPFEAKISAPSKTAPPKKKGCRIKQEGHPACKGSNPIFNGKHGNKVRRNGVFERFSSGNRTELMRIAWKPILAALCSWRVWVFHRIMNLYDTTLRQLCLFPLLRCFCIWTDWKNTNKPLRGILIFTVFFLVSCLKSNYVTIYISWIWNCWQSKSNIKSC